MSPLPRLNRGALLHAGKRLLRLALGLLALGLVFDLAYEKWPLYTSNENTYLLHGLALAGRGFLRDDWLARTADATPVFSRLAALSARLLPERVFVFEHAFLTGVYTFALTGIVVAWHERERRKHPARLRSAAVALAALLIVLHSAALEHLGSLPASVGGLPVSRYFHEGVAYQYILGHMFQPSVFGVFLPLAIYLHLRGRPRAAVLAATTAALFHPTYLLSALSLDAAFLFLALRRHHRLREATHVALTAAISLLPITLYALLTFAATTPASQQQAQHLIVSSRIPFHAIPARWLDKGAYLQLGLVVLGLIFVRRSRLLALLAIPFLIALALTLVQIVSPRDGLALLFPWRMSIFLVPLASALILGWIVVKLHSHRFHRPVCALLVLASLFAIIPGFPAAGLALAEPAPGELVRAVIRERAPGQLYLVPTGMDRFRLEAGVPIFVDQKSHPYKDVEVLEWSRRLDLARAFYAGADCAKLDDLRARYGVTHALVPTKLARSACPGWTEKARAGGHALWKKN